MIGPYFGIIPDYLASLDLTGREFRVLLAIARHASKASKEPRTGVIEMRIAEVGTQRIADATKINRRHVHTVILQLEAKGILELHRGGGRKRGSTQGNVTEYLIIFKRGVDTNCTAFDAVSDAVNCTIHGNDTAPSTGINCTVHGARTESEQKERTDPPSGESRARPRGEVFSNDGGDEEVADRRQPSLLLPFNGGGNRMAPLRSYNPSTELIAWAAEQYSINALDDRVLGQFIDYHLERDRLPADIEAAYRRWIRIERQWAERDAARTGPGLSAPEDAAVAASRDAEFADAMQRSARQ